MIFLTLIGITNLAHLLVFVYASSNTTNVVQNGMTVPRTVDKFSDMGETYMLGHNFSWSGGEKKVYNQDGKALYTIVNQLESKTHINEITINDVSGKELLRLFPQFLNCRSEQSFKTTTNVTYTFDRRGWATDKWYIHGDALKHKDYTYQRRANSNTGSIKIGDSKKDRVAKTFQEEALPGWQSEVFSDKGVWIIRSNGELEPEVLLGFLATTVLFYHKCRL